MPHQIFLVPVGKWTSGWRSVSARSVGGTFEIIDSVPPSEKWQFEPGSIVRCEPHRFVGLTRATYEFFSKKVRETTRVDLRPYLGSEGQADPLVEELERLRNELIWLIAFARI